MDQTKTKNKVGQGIVTIFGFSEMTALFLANINTLYFSFFITDLLMIAPAVMSTVLIITRFADIGTILLSSFMEERLDLKWGKYRSWLLLMVPLAVVISLIQYSGMGGTANVRLIISAVCYVLFFAFFNFGRTAQLALLNTIGRTPKERQMLSARKAQFAAVSGIILSASIIPMALLFSGAKSQTNITIKGFFITIAIFQIVYLVSQMGLFKASKPFDIPSKELSEGGTSGKAAAQQKLSGKEMGDQLIKNPPLLLLLGSETCRNIANTLVLSCAIYYFKVVAQDLTYQTYFSTFVTLAGFVGTLFAGEVLMRKLSKKSIYMIGFAAPCVALLLARFLAASNTVVFFVLVGVAWFFFNGVFTCGPAMFGDCVEYGKYKTGKEARGFIMGLYTLPIKVGVLIAGGISGYALSAVGYSAKAVVTPALKSGLFNIVTLIPAAIFAIGFICSVAYPLNNSRVNEIMTANAEK